MATKGLGLLIGDGPIAQYVFGSAKKRKKVLQLKEDGWPIIEVARKNAARPESLDDEVSKRTRQPGQSDVKARPLGRWDRAANCFPSDTAK